MATTIKLKNSVTTTNAPSSLAQGEVAINVTDKKVWVGNAATTPVQLLGTGADGNFTNLTVTNNATFDTTTLVVDATNNRVGVGLTSPAYAFDAEGDFRHRNFAGGSLSGFFNCANTGSVTLNFGGTTTPNKGRIFYSDNSDLFSFFTNSTERMRIDSSGNVGIGTSSPSSKLHLKGSGLQQLTIESTTTNPVLFFATASGQNPYVQWQSAGGSALKFYDATVGLDRVVIDSSGNVGIGTSSPSYKLHVVGGQTRLDVSSAGTSLVCLGTGSNFQVDHSTSGYATLINSANSGAAMIFKGSSESMRIDSSGNLLVGCTSAPSSTVKGTRITADYSSNANFISVGNTTAGTSVFAFFNGNGVVGSISLTGSVTSYNVTSDRRLKENITPFNNGLSTITALKPRQYNYIADKDVIYQGFIADELQVVIPHAVTGKKDALDKDGKPVYQGVDASFLIPHLVSAIQELKTIVDAQAERIAVLESK